MFHGHQTIHQRKQPCVGPCVLTVCLEERVAITQWEEQTRRREQHLHLGLVPGSSHPATPAPRSLSAGSKQLHSNPIHNHGQHLAFLPQSKFHFAFCRRCISLIFPSEGHVMASYRLQIQLSLEWGTASCAHSITFNTQKFYKTPNPQKQLDSRAQTRSAVEGVSPTAVPSAFFPEPHPAPLAASFFFQLKINNIDIYFFGS